ncbi:MAG: TraB/GumN family protein [Duncaniella sp.]|nr:TraB/GumN family protein [Duncaniella sp.]
MKRILNILVCIAAAFGGTADAQLLWRISGNGLEKPSYIFGTHHVAPVSVIDSVPGLNDAIRSVDVVCGEMDMSGDLAATQGAVMRYALAPADSLLSALLAPTQLDSANVVLKKYMGAGADIRMMDAMKPAMLTTLLTVMQTQRLFPDFDAERQIDRVIQLRAAEAGREVMGLETPDEQARLLFGEPLTRQAEQLMEVVRNDDTAGETAAKIASCYLAGDLDGLLALMDDAEAGLGDAAEPMLYRRNAKWVEVIASIIPTRSMLVAVGAAHLPGEKGVIQKLKNIGFEVVGI